MPPLEPTSAAEWPKAEEAVIARLPSGGVAKLRRPPLSYYVATGNLPAQLRARLNKEGSEFFRDPYASMDAKELQTFVDWLVACAFVEPRVSMTRKAGCVYVGDLDEDDKGRVMELLGLRVA